MKSKTLKHLAIGLSVAMIAGIFTAVPTMAKVKGKLVSSVQSQVYDKKAKKYVNNYKVSFLYTNEKDPITILEESSIKGNEYFNSFTQNYKYKNKKRRKMTQYVVGTNLGTNGAPGKNLITYNTKGKIAKKTFSDFDSSCYMKGKTTYSYKGGYVSQIYDYLRYEDTERTSVNKAYYKYNTTIKNGTLSKIVSYIKMNSDKKFKKHATTTFNKDGLVKKVAASKSTYATYKYTMKNNRVSKVEVREVAPDTPLRKSAYIFKYSSKRAAATRYQCMVNELVKGTSVFVDFFDAYCLPWY